MIRVAITGSGGFLGSHFVELLKGRAEYTTISVRSKLVDVNIDSVYDYGKITRHFRETRPERIYHLAGLTKSTQTEDYYRVNYHYAQSIVHAIIEGAPSAKLVLIGSGSEYGDYDNCELPLKESFIGKPRSHHGVSKFIQTELGKYHSRNGYSVWLPRIFNLVGPGQSSDYVLGKVVNFVKNAKKRRNKKSLQLGYLGDMRDFVDVRDVCDLLWQLPTSPELLGKVVNICTGQPVCIREIAYDILHQAESDIEIAEKEEPTFGANVHYGDPSLLETTLGIKMRLDRNRVIEDMLSPSRK